MELTFLGSGACFFPELYNTSAYFVHNNNLILLDCGETVYERLMKLEDISKYEQIYVILTHLHADHVGSLGSLLSYCTCILKKRIHVVYPDNQVCRLLSMLGIADNFYYHLKMLGDKVPHLSVEPVKVSHASDMECFGYKITCDDSCIYYSGDASGIPECILKKFLSGEIQKIYQDTSTYDVNCKSHMYVGVLEELIPDELRKQVVCMHLDSECHDILHAKGFSTAE